ncbi:uncharacterized protein [Triticum aestivum]|uniref:uncharacterized protein n=1 Tax=Triticum aestivum TaxID=4565 RepID=UPI001D01473E|nr:uncharacterized protein LOC123067633 [Triticum aestivum]
MGFDTDNTLLLMKCSKEDMLEGMLLLLVGVSLLLKKYRKEDVIESMVLLLLQCSKDGMLEGMLPLPRGVLLLLLNRSKDVMTGDKAHTKNKAPEESGARGTRNTQFLNTRSQSHPSLSPPTHNTYPKPNPPTPPPRICAPPPQISSSFPSRHGISDPGLPSLIPHSRRSSNIPLTSSNASRRAESEEQQHRPPASSSSVVRQRQLVQRSCWPFFFLHRRSLSRLIPLALPRLQNSTYPTLQKAMVVVIAEFRRTENDYTRPIQNDLSSS